ncbi:MAG: hypothetical protein B6241_14120 [Spirochaetaceae bacterium 4572_59]|nr:MAG: hypothetical protein B6241_14120 [Spirochaetaceae bacterium 4572_59]
MFAIPDFSVALAFLLLIITTLVSCIYGVLNWNKGAATEEEIETEKQWMKEEIELDESVDGGVIS